MLKVPESFWECLCKYLPYELKDLSDVPRVCLGSVSAPLLASQKCVSSPVSPVSHSANPCFPTMAGRSPSLGGRGSPPNLCLNLYRPACVALMNKAHKTQLTWKKHSNKQTLSRGGLTSISRCASISTKALCQWLTHWWIHENIYYILTTKRCKINWRNIPGLLPLDLRLLFMNRGNFPRIDNGDPSSQPCLA